MTTKLSTFPRMERRHEAPNLSELWPQLSLAQKFSVSSLGKFGYKLLFVRHEQGENIAVLECNGGYATIADDGEINTSAQINLRAE